MTSTDPTVRGPQPPTAPFGERTVHIDTAPAPIYAESSGYGSGSNTHQQDVAGVLRRNQACLQCRKRKLKCDAARPHCATCVRSYRHLLRTSPKSNPVLCCDYDDGTGHHDETEREKGTEKGPAEAPSGPDDDDHAAKKKRKSSGEGKRKKKDEGFEEERDRLTKKIEELEARLSNQHPTPPENYTGEAPSRGSASRASAFQDAAAAPSPTAFLEMLSSAASGKASSMFGVPSPSASYTAPSSDTAGPMWGGAFKFAPQNTADSDALPGLQSGGSSGSSMHNPTPPGPPTESPIPNILSPNGIFNFSPGPTSVPEMNQGSQWPPVQMGPDGLQPSTKVDGPWRAVETIETVFAASMGGSNGQDYGSGQEPGMETEINMDGLQAGLDAAMQQQLLMDLFWPGWPSNLPEPNVVNDLIEAFFDLVPNLPRLLHRARLLARMALPPTHPNFPHPSLIHAICAAAAAWCPPEVYEKSSRVKGWEFQETTGVHMIPERLDPLGLNGGGPKSAFSFGLKQAAFAKDAVTDGLNTGNRLFDVVRAMIILGRVFIDDTRMLECWAYGGLVARMLLPLGLNVRSAELSLKSVMLPPPADALEREERRAAVWMAFYHDTIGSAASGWGTSMATDELSVPLPVSAEDFNRGNEVMEPNPQDLESPDLWVMHPVVDSFVMVIKATILMNRVNKFARRWKNRHLRDNDDYEGMNKPEFRDVANAISCFQMSFPPSMRNVCKLDSKKRFDIDLIAAQMLPHAAIICLYEPFADVTDPSDQATRRVLAATQAIVSIVHQLASVVSDGSSNMVSRNFTSVMHASASVCLVTSARTSILFLRHALNVGDMVAAQSHRTDCEMIRMALSQFGLKFKIGHHHAQLVEYFLDRATNPTYEKIVAHYPDHPRHGAPELTPNADLGLCILNALNVKRGFWRVSAPRGQDQHRGSTTSTDASPFGSDNSSGSGSGRSNIPPNGASSSSTSFLPNGDPPADGVRMSWDNYQPQAHLRRVSSDHTSRPGTSGDSDPFPTATVSPLSENDTARPGTNAPSTKVSGPDLFHPCTLSAEASASASNRNAAVPRQSSAAQGMVDTGDQAYVPRSSGWSMDLPSAEPRPSLPVVEDPHASQLDPVMEHKLNTMRLLRGDGHMDVFPSFSDEEIALIQRSTSHQDPVGPGSEQYPTSELDVMEMLKRGYGIK